MIEYHHSAKLNRPSISIKLTAAPRPRNVFEGGWSNVFLVSSRIVPPLRERCVTTLKTAVWQTTPGGGGFARYAIMIGFRPEPVRYKLK